MFGTIESPDSFDDQNLYELFSRLKGSLIIH